MKKRLPIIAILLTLAALTASAQERLIRFDNERMEIRNNSEKLSFYHKELVRLLMPESAAFGVERIPSNGKESALTYDSVACAFVYRVAEANIWSATRKTPYEAPAVQTFTIPTTQEYAQDIKRVLQYVIDDAEVREDNQLDGIRWEYFCDGQRAYTKDHNGMFAKYTNELMECVRTGNTDRIESILGQIR